jgi:hypothetical protein
MPLDFPASPATGDIFTSGDAMWRWTGAAWTRRMEQAQRTRAQLVNWIAAGGIPLEGQAYFGGDYCFLGSAGATEIADLPGLVPAGAIQPGHYKNNAVPGTTDMTAAILAACDWADATSQDSIAGGAVYFRSGTYLVSATIDLPSARLRLHGDGWRSSVIYRTGEYGDTFTCAGGFLVVDDMCFQHSAMPVNLAAAAPLANQLDDDSAHFRLTNAAKSYFNRCFFSRMPYHIVWTGSSLLHLDGCEFTGAWHPSDATMQETKRSILLNDGTEDRSQLFKAKNCRWVGTVGPSASVSIVDGSANVSTLTMTKEQAWGPEYHLEIQCCEMLVVEACYFNRGSSGLVLYAANLPEVGGGPNYGHSWTNCEFDSGTGQPNTAYSNQISFMNREPGCVTRLITFTSCKFYGGKNVKHAVYPDTATVTDPDTGATTANSPSVYGLTFVNCTFMNFTGAPLYLKGAKVVTVADCIFGAWNSLGLPNVDKEYTAAIWRGQYALKVNITGCSFGGGGNTFVPVGGVFGSGSDAGEQVNHAYQGVYDAYPTDGELTFAANNLDVGCRDYLWYGAMQPGSVMTFYVADDAVGNYPLHPSFKAGFATVRVGADVANPGDARMAAIYYNSGSSPACVKNSGYSGVGGTIDASTSALAGTTGTDARITVSSNSQKLQVENRIGSSQYITVTVQ